METSVDLHLHLSSLGSLCTCPRFYPSDAVNKIKSVKKEKKNHILRWKVTKYKVNFVFFKGIFWLKGFTFKKKTSTNRYC